MNGDIQATRKLLAELREAYRSLPQHARAHVTDVLRAVAQEQAAQLTSRKEGTCNDENWSLKFASFGTISSSSS